MILFLDGHDSHESEKFQNTAFEHGIIVVAFPSKCTHNLQPLDVVVFSQTQHHWTKHCDYWLHKGVQMDRYNIIQCNAPNGALRLDFSKGVSCGRR